MSYITRLDTTEQPIAFALRANDLVATLKSYMPVFAQAVQNAASREDISPEERQQLSIQYSNAETFLQTWRDHASGETVTSAEFDGLRQITRMTDDTIHKYISKPDTLALSKAAFAFVGK